MAQSTCIKCGWHNFELMEQSFVGAKYKMFLVQCASCGTPVGVVPFYDPGVTANIVSDKVDKLEREIQDIQYTLNDIRNNMR